jgi:hypothetical protein
MPRKYALMAAAVLAAPLLALTGMHAEVGPHRAPAAPASTVHHTVHEVGVQALVGHRD